MSFLSNFMQFALEMTQSTRSVALNSAFEWVDRANVDDKTLQNAKFAELAQHVTREAVALNAPVITNNIITDPSLAPVTNTSFTDLRLVVAIPLQGVGVIYLDRPIKLGVIQRELIERLMAFGNRLTQEELTHFSTTAMREAFEQG